MSARKGRAMIVRMIAGTANAQSIDLSSCRKELRIDFRSLVVALTANASAARTTVPAVANIFFVV